MSHEYIVMPTEACVLMTIEVFSVTAGDGPIVMPALSYAHAGALVSQSNQLALRVILKSVSNIGELSNIVAENVSVPPGPL